MNTKKVPMRSCIVTKEKLEKRDLFRIVRTPEKEIIIDNEKGKANGRGAYLKKDVDVINKAEKSKILNRVLEVEIPANIYDELRSALDGKN